MKRPLLLPYRRQDPARARFADPAPHGGIAVEVKAALMRHTRIGKQRNVGERNRIADQEPRLGQMMLHPRQRCIAALDLFGIEIGGGLAEIEHDEAADRDIRLVAVLLPEQPFVHLGRRKASAGMRSLPRAR